MSLKVENYIPVIRQARGYYSDFSISAPISDKGGLVYDVKAFGAVGDGVTDDSAAIQNAINTAAAEAYSGSVYLSPGNYKLLSALVPKSRVAIRGAGFGISVLQPRGTVSAIQDITSTALAPLTDITLTDFEIDGSLQTGSPYNVQTKGIFMLFLERAIFKNLYVHDTAATGVGADFFKDSIMDGIIANGCGRLNGGSNPGGSGIGVGVGEFASHENLIITNCHATGNARYGIFIETQDGSHPTGTIITNCTVTGNLDGIGECGGSGTVIANCIITGNTGSGVDVSQGTFTAPTPGINTTITGNFIGSNGTFGVKMYSAAGETLRGYKVSNNQFIGNKDGVYVETTDTIANNFDISDNFFSGNLTRAIVFQQATGVGTYSHVRIANNMIRNQNQAGGVAATAGGIRITENIEDLQMINNRVFDDQAVKTQPYALFIAAGVTISGGKIEGNDFRDNRDNSFVLNGTLTNVDVRNNAGYNPIGTSAITVGASPYTYTAGNSPENVYISGGTVSAIVKSAITLYASTDKLVHLEPRQAVVVTYSVTPTMVKDIL